MAMMAATSAAAGLAGIFLLLLFVAGVALYLWARD